MTIKLNTKFLSIPQIVTVYNRFSGKNTRTFRSREYAQDMVEGTVLLAY